MDSSTSLRPASKPIDGDRYELLARIASLYFEDDLSQAEIAAQTGYSRSMISRLLTEAREQRIVEIRINHPLARHRELEQALQETLGLQGVRVLTRGTLNYGTMLRRVGTLAARMVEELLRDHMIIGVSWGSAVWETVNALRSGVHGNVQVIQTIGSLGTPDPEIDGPELARRLARIFGGRYSTLPVPLVVSNEQTRDALVADPKIQRVIDSFKQIELALMGVGTVEPERSSLLRAGYASEAELDDMRQAGAVGDVCALHFDLDGQLLDVPTHRRRIGISPEQLTRIPMKVGIAGGQFKSAPIVGAARARFINMLVTDEVAALGALQAAT